MRQQNDDVVLLNEESLQQITAGDASVGPFSALANGLSKIIDPLAQGVDGSIQAAGTFFKPVIRWIF